MSQATSRRRLYPALAAGVLVALVCGATLKVIHSSSQDKPTVEAQVPAQQESEPLAPLTPFDSGPFLQASPSFRLADPALLQSTSPNERADAVVAGRPDPFAPIVRPTAVPNRPRPAQAEAAVVPTQVSPGQPLPMVPVVSNQTLPPLPSLPPLSLPGTVNQPVQEVAVAPTMAPLPQSPVDQIAITGVAQIGNTVSVIVRETGSASGRHVRAGDILAGGQVRVKSIDTSTAEPTVVLTYNGQDYTRTVGSGALIGSL